MLTNRKSEERKGTVQLIDGSGFFQKMRKSLGSKRKELGQADIDRIVKLYGEYADAESEYSKVFKIADFGYKTITIERPLRVNYGVTKDRIAVGLASRGLSKLTEGEEIADYLDFETAEIDAAIADAKEAIELSKERRAALISAAVTGKIDVRDYAAVGLGAA